MSGPVVPSERERAAIRALERHLTLCAVEYVAQVNGGPGWTVPATGEQWTVEDPGEDDGGPLVLVLDSSGLRVEVDAWVFVAAQRTTRRGVMPDGGWPVEPSTTT